MTERDTGGTAFPCHTIAMHEGMALRDYFAAKAMQSTLADDAYVARTETALEWISIVAKSSYEIADAMLKARSV